MKPQNPFDKTRYEVILIEDRSVVKPMILENHYLHRWPTKAQWVFGVVQDRSRLVGTIIFGGPGRRELSKSVSPLVQDHQITELQRLWIEDGLGGNIESWAIGQSFRLLKRLAPHKIVVVSYADPAAGHVGTIYKACGGLYQELARNNNSFQVNLTDNPNDWIHTRTQQRVFGRHSIEELKFKIGQTFWIRPDNRKYRYVWFLCNRVERKKLIASMKHIAPYPTHTIEPPKPVLIDVTGVTSRSDTVSPIQKTEDKSPPVFNLSKVKPDTIYNEDCLTTMSRLPDECIDLTVTSPPYDNMRTFHGYVFDFEAIATQLLRITKEGGVIVWNVGDQVLDGSESGTSFRQALFFKEIGFNLHDTMIYQKTGAAYWSVNVHRRYAQVFEYMFVFSKGKPETVNLIRDRPNKATKSTGVSYYQMWKPDGTRVPLRLDRPVQPFGVRTNIWRIKNGKTDDFKREHPAVFPDQLAGDHITTWSNKGELVYDPFMGSGTTAVMAKRLERHYLGSEVSAEYCRLAAGRLSKQDGEIVLAE